MAEENVNHPLSIIGNILSKEARMLARAAAPDDAVAARALARALRDPERVARLVEGLLPAEMQAAV